MASEWETVGLDPTWIARHSVVGGRTPESAEFAGFIGTGQMSRNARFALDWADATGPASVVVKVPSADAGTRSVSFPARSSTGVDEITTPVGRDARSVSCLS